MSLAHEHPSNSRRQFLMSLALAALGIGAAGEAARADEQVVKVVARRFTFNPAEIHLKKGVPAVLELTSLDVMMGIDVPDIGVRSDILPGAVSRLRFTPQKAGDFPFHCDIFCGSGHESMAGVIKVS